MVLNLFLVWQICGKQTNKGRGCSLSFYLFYFLCLVTIADINNSDLRTNSNYCIITRRSNLSAFLNIINSKMFQCTINVYLSLSNIVCSFFVAILQIIIVLWQYINKGYLVIIQIFAILGLGSNFFQIKINTGGVCKPDVGQSLLRSA